ncbi:hypothetical protein [Candidatus Lokiarchaeum ossiferum]|uniref:hypothetical protein n=1 Tax=Candidatus Lokiarchaeum ossiferum TaxID=2951803 RepID=UPI00352EE159
MSLEHNALITAECLAGGKIGNRVDLEEILLPHSLYLSDGFEQNTLSYSVLESDVNARIDVKFHLKKAGTFKIIIWAKTDVGTNTTNGYFFLDMYRADATNGLLGSGDFNFNSQSTNLKRYETDAISVSYDNCLLKFRWNKNANDGDNTLSISHIFMERQ